MRLFAFAAASLMLAAGAAFAQAPDAASPPPAPPADAAPAPENPAMTGPQLLIQTSMGDIVLQLDSQRAPQSVAHILRLARMGFYNGSCIYRVEKDFVIQMGSWDANGNGHGWTPRPVTLEADNGLKNYKYAVALPRGDDPNGAGPDFYINMRDNLNLDQKPDDPRSGFAVFGSVTEASLPVVQAINAVAVGGGKGPFAASSPTTPVVIAKVSVVGDPPPRPAASAKPAPAKPAPRKPR
jgi:cyclophilin family peptidyl-prolyl cis-trans isomerase